MNLDTKIVAGTILISTLLVVGGFIIASKQAPPSVSKEDLVTEDGLHWHSQLKIVIRGKEDKIPKDIGIGAVHNPIHTHDETGTIHMEFSGLVKKEDLRLANFFRIWGKEFNSKCIFDNCAKNTTKTMMFVNGKKNTLFENYRMKDTDKIEIRYE